MKVNKPLVVKSSTATEIVYETPEPQKELNDNPQTNDDVTN